MVKPPCGCLQVAEVLLADPAMKPGHGRTGAEKHLDSLVAEPVYVLAEHGEEFGCDTCNYAVLD